jgi:SAM-dependent methyltransferase
VAADREGAEAAGELLRRCDGWNMMLDEAFGALAVLSGLVAALDRLARTSGQAAWSAVRAGLAGHPLAMRLRQDPLIGRAWRRGPAGLGGDPVLGDLLLRHPDVAHLVTEASPLGRDLHVASTGLPWPVAVRERQRVIARLADAAAERRHGAEILAVAPGLMREAPLSLAGSGGEIARWIALDDDAAVLAGVHRAMPVPWVQPVQADPLSALAQAQGLGRFDLIYQKILDLWDDAAAAALVRAAVARLRPGGRLVLCNRAPDTQDGAFWSLGAGRRRCMRDEAALEAVLRAADPARIAACRAVRTMNGVFVVGVLEAA